MKARLVLAVVVALVMTTCAPVLPAQVRTVPAGFPTNGLIGTSRAKILKQMTAFDGTPPTTANMAVAMGVTAVRCFTQVLRTTAVSTGTAFVTVDSSVATAVNIYPWLLTGASSTGTEIFYLTCIGL